MKQCEWGKHHLAVIIHSEKPLEKFVCKMCMYQTEWMEMQEGLQYREN